MKSSLTIHFENAGVSITGTGDLLDLAAAHASITAAILTAMKSSPERHNSLASALILYKSTETGIEEALNMIADLTTDE